LLQFPNPNVPVMHRIPAVSQPNRRRVRVFLRFGRISESRAEDFKVILDERAVMPDGDPPS